MSCTHAASVSFLANMIPDDISSSIPKLGSTRSDRDPTVWLRFLNPDAARTWLVTEFDGKETFFGWVEDGNSVVPRQFTVTELQSSFGHYGLPVERDLRFAPKPVSEAL